MSDSSEIKADPVNAEAAMPEMKDVQKSSPQEMGEKAELQPATALAKPANAESAQSEIAKAEIGKAKTTQTEPVKAKLANTEPAKAVPATGETAKKPRKRRRLKVAHPERCIGCLSCMFACSRIHTGRASLIDSCIKIQTQGGIEGDFRVVVCRGCENPPCVRACPAGALERRPDGSVRLNKDLCTKCGKCSDACLVGAISMGKEGTPIKCQHCGACVAFCPHGVLELEEVAA